MNGKNHAIAGVGAGIALAILCAKVGDVEGVVMAIPSAVVGAKLPDVDHVKTKQGKVFSAIRGLAPFIAVASCLFYIYMVMYHGMRFNPIVILIPVAVAWFLRDGTWFWGHRHGTHTLIFPLMFAAMYLCFRDTYPAIAICLAGLNFGYLSHLATDTMTHDGCPLLYPITKKTISLSKIKSKEEKKCRALAIIFDVVLNVLVIIL